MYWINGLYTYTPPGGNPQFQSANPAGGVPNGTEITSAWLNQVQAELIAPVQWAGLAPSATDSGQLLKVIQALGTCGGNHAVFSGATLLTTQVTFIVPFDCTIKIDGNCGTSSNITGLSMVATNATSVINSANWSGTGSGNNAGVFTGLYTAVQGASVTLELEATCAAGSSQSIGFTYMLLPRA